MLLTVRDFIALDCNWETAFLNNPKLRFKKKHDDAFQLLDKKDSTVVSTNIQQNNYNDKTE